MNDFITFSISPNVKKSIASYLRKKEGVIGRQLKAKLKESIEYIREKIADYAPEETGTLKETIRSLPISSSAFSFSLEQSGRIRLYMPLVRKKDQQILWVDRGTGIYGPTRRVITPTSSRFLYFEIGGQLIRTRSIKGQKGQRFISSALANSKLIVETKIRSALKEL